MDAKLILTIHDLRKLPMTWYSQERKAIERKLKEAVESKWDNNRLMFEQWDLYSLSIRRVPALPGSPAVKSAPGTVTFDENNQAKNLFNVNVWDSSGNAALGSWTFTQNPNKPMNEDIQREIKDVCSLYYNGQIHCSECGKLIELNDIAGSYFAGRYCKTCWETKWKAREAAENYN